VSVVFLYSVYAEVLMLEGVCSFFMIAFASYVEVQAEDNFKQSFSEWLKVRHPLLFRIVVCMLDNFIRQIDSNGDIKVS
jgi:hypothetical protein